MSVDKIIMDYYYAQGLMSTDELKEALHSLLISKLPEKHKNVEKTPTTSNTLLNRRIGYNAAVNLMRKSIDELFEVQNA